MHMSHLDALMVTYDGYHKRAYGCAYGYTWLHMDAHMDAHIWMHMMAAINALMGSGWVHMIGGWDGYIRFMMAAITHSWLHPLFALRAHARTYVASS